MHAVHTTRFAPVLPVSAAHVPVPVLAALALAVAASLWGTSFVAAKIVMSWARCFSPIQLAGAGFLVAGAALAVKQKRPDSAAQSGSARNRENDRPERRADHDLRPSDALAARPRLALFCYKRSCC